MTAKLMGVGLMAVLLVSAFSADAKKPKKDRGEATMKIADKVWTAKSASARLRGDRLVINATLSERIDGLRHRETVRLVIKGYAGPGAYQANASSSFSKVDVDIDKLKASKGNQDAESKVVTDMMKSSDVILLRGANVVIESADVSEFRGTFTQTNKTPGPMITDGRFRARVKKTRAKRRGRGHLKSGQ